MSPKTRPKILVLTEDAKGLPAPLRQALSTAAYDAVYSAAVEAETVREAALVVLADGRFLQFVALFKEADPSIPSIVIARTDAERDSAIYAGAADLLTPETPADEILTKIDTVLRLSENAAPLEERARLDNVLDAMEDGIVLLGPELRVQRLNEKAKTLLGAKGGDDFVRLLVTQYRVEDAANLAHRLSAGPLAFDAERPETEALRALVLEIRTNVVRDWMRQVRGVVAVVADVTERRRRAAQEEEFLNLISHKLRTPMAIVHKNASMFHKKVLGPLNPDQEKFMGVLYDKCCELVDSFEKLLGFTMLKSHALGLPPEPVDLGTTLKDGLEQYFARKRGKRVEWTAETSGEPVLSIHPKYWDMALQNVLENAMKFAVKEPVKLDVRAERAGADVVVTVRDDGPGIPPEDLQKVFEPFYQVDRDRTLNVAGTGLGLAIVRRILEAHGGRIDVESELGRGTTFRLTLPAAGA